MKSPLYTQYKTQVVPALKKSLQLSNVMQVPAVSKVVVNVGFGRHAKEKAYIENVVKTLTRLTGQKPVLNKSKKSISNFKIRAGMEIGASVTLRGNRMYDFLYKLVHLALPRVRDFRGLDPRVFDGKGNYTIGFKENIAFPEITADTVESIHGLELVIVTTAKTNQAGLMLLKELGFPFRS